LYFPIVISQTEASGMGLTSAVVNIRTYQSGYGIDRGYSGEDNSVRFLPIILPGGSEGIIIRLELISGNTFEKTEELNGRQDLS